MKTKRRRSGQIAEVGVAEPGSVRAGLEGILRVDGDAGVISDYSAEHSENGIERGEVEETPEQGKGSRAKESRTKNRAKEKKAAEIAFRELLDVGRNPDAVIDDSGFSVTESNGSVWNPSKLDCWIRRNLWIRTKKVARTRFEHNRVQREYSRVCLEKGSRKNIVLKARQVGMTSYIAARLFALTVARPGTLTMLVAHNREAAEEIFRIVHRYWDNLDKGLREGPLRTSHSSARELVFPELDSEFTVASADENAGRGRTIQNLHCTEVSRWGREGEEALAALRGALVPDGEIVLEVKFKDGLTQIVNGTVTCLNASVWAQKKVGGGV